MVGKRHGGFVARRRFAGAAVFVVFDGAAVVLARPHGVGLNAFAIFIHGGERHFCRDGGGAAVPAVGLGQVFRHVFAVTVDVAEGFGCFGGAVGLVVAFKRRFAVPAAGGGGVARAQYFCQFVARFGFA